MEQQTLPSTSSPTHEFSFTISLNSTANPLTIDLTPADEIFFHGQLLPLPLHSSTNSLDDFTLPARNTMVDECDKNRGHSFNSYEYNTSNKVEFLSKERAKSKSFSLLRRRAKEAEEDEKHKKKPRFDMGNFLKRYIKLFSKEKREDIQLRKKPYSFSGKLSQREGGTDFKGRISAPASITTSPRNSGIIMEDSRAIHHSSNDSSMEELQAAIQSAIAHCKNSISAGNKAILS